MFVVRLFAAAAVATLAVLMPATAAFAVDPVDPPDVTATATADHTVRLDWYVGSDVPQVEVATKDSSGSTATHTFDATAGSATFTDLPAGSWQADVTAVRGGGRSDTITVMASVTAPAVVPTPTPTPTPAPTSTPVGPATTQATVDLSVVAGSDGSEDSASVHLIATGLAASSTATVTLDGASFGTAVVGADGRVDQSFPLPAGLAEGTHRLDFSGIDPEQVTVTSSYSFAIGAPVAAAPVEVQTPTQDLTPSVLDTSGDAAVPYLVAGTVAATVATGAAAAAASTATARVRRVRVGRLLDAEFAGRGGAQVGGAKSFISDFITSIRGVR